MKYGISKDGDTLVARVPTLERHPDMHRKYAVHTRKLTVHSLEKARFELIAWQTRTGQKLWGRYRWERIKEKGVQLYDSEWKGARAVFDNRKDGPRWMAKRMWSRPGCKRYRAFGVKKYTAVVAQKLAEFQAVIWRAEECQSDLILPLEIVNAITDGNPGLFPELKPMKSDDGKEYLAFFGDKL